MQFEYDESVRALYITLTDRPVARTVEALEDRVYVDLDDRNDIVGVEVLGVPSAILSELLPEIERILEDVRAKTGRELAIA
jgi:uncharacterized protein YuzE